MTSTRAATDLASSPGGEGWASHHPMRSGESKNVGKNPSDSHILGRNSIDLFGKRIGAAHHVDSHSRQVEVGVAKGERHFRPNHLATRVDDTSGQMRRRVHGSSCLPAQDGDRAGLSETKAPSHRERLLLGGGRNRHIATMGSDLAVSQKVEPH